MQHDHHHSHAHGHHLHEVPKTFATAFAIGIALNFSFVIVEGVFGYLSHSMALVADAGHNLGDVGGLILAWGASYLASRPPSKRFTYGLRQSSILAALLNAVILFIAIGAIGWESIRRFTEPALVAETTVIWVAALGIFINTTTALLFVKGRKQDINLRSAYWHMIADAGISLGVVVTGFAILWTGWVWLDPAVSIVIAIFIGYGTWGILRSSFHMAMDAVPDTIDPVSVRQYLERQQGVLKIHDLHIWPMSTTEVALTVHMVIPEPQDEDAFLNKIAHDLEDKFGIAHSTIQVERGKGEHSCHLEPDEVV